MDFQRGMWAEAWVQTINARKFAALAVFGELVLRLSMEWSPRPPSASSMSAAVFSTFLWAYLAYAVHAQVLLPRERIYTTVNTKVLGFAMRTLGIAFVVLAAFIVGALVLAKIIGSADIGFLLAMIVLGFPVFVWLATLLPAYVAGRARGVNAAIERGKAQFGWIAGRLLIGPCLLFILSGLLYSLLAIPSDDKNLFWNEERVFLPVNVILYLLYNTVQALTTALTAVILSRAFLREEGMPDTAAA